MATPTMIPLHTLSNLFCYLVIRTAMLSKDLWFVRVNPQHKTLTKGMVILNPLLTLPNHACFPVPLFCYFTPHELKSSNSWIWKPLGCFTVVILQGGIITVLVFVFPCPHLFDVRQITSSSSTNSSNTSPSREVSCLSCRNMYNTGFYNLKVACLKRKTSSLTCSLLSRWVFSGGVGE